MPAEGAKTVPKTVATKSSACRIESVGEGTRTPRAHSTGKMCAARMSAAEAASATESAAGTAKSARVSAATLCPDGHGEEESQRRNREQAPHTQPL